MSRAVLRLHDATEIYLDEKGYLLEPADWTLEVAERMAASDGIDLTSDHRVVIEIFRDYFSRFDIEPPMRALVKLAQDQFGAERGNSRFLYRLFPEGPTTQACRYAGLPRPVSCL